MSNPLLVAIANATQYNATMTSTNGSGDGVQIPAFNNAFTGGSDNNNIHIPECSGEQYYRSHHILIQGMNASGGVAWTVALWANDAQNAVLFWNNTDGYSESHQLSGSGGGQAISAIYIGIDGNGNVFVHATSVQS